MVEELDARKGQFQGTLDKLSASECQVHVKLPVASHLQHWSRTLSLVKTAMVRSHQSNVAKQDYATHQLSNI